MGLFDIFKTGRNKKEIPSLKEEHPETNINHEKEITVNNPPLCAQADTSSFNSISNEVLNLLWIKGGKLNNYAIGLNDEPSLIDISLEVSYESDDSNIGYYPSYSKLTPSQRGKYIKWLEDITQPIDIGYVFIFYYGLERHILFGKRNEAVSMIIKLRSVHKNNSFLTYSADAIMVSAYMDKSPYLLSELVCGEGSPLLKLFINAMLNQSFGPSELIVNCRKFGFTNTRYIKSRPEEFESSVYEVLQRKYGEPIFKLSKEDFTNCKSRFPVVLANYSLEYSERISSLPDVSSNEDLCNRIYSVLTEAHNALKNSGKPTAKQQTKAKHIEVNTELIAPQHFIPERYLDTKPLNDDEIKFINAFYNKVKHEKFASKIHSERKSDGCLNFLYKDMQIGRVRLQGKKHRMQILSLSDVSWLDGELEDFIPHTDDWIKYIKKDLLY